jgi:hypothetical protein
MKEKPILFSTEMVQAILAGRKTQTRRVAKISSQMAPKDIQYLDNALPRFQFKAGYMSWQIECPYGKVGDILWVRETLEQSVTGGALYRAGGKVGEPLAENEFVSWDDFSKSRKVIPSIHMPKDAARIWLRIKDVRVERLQDISEDDALAEGIDNLTWKDMAYPQNFFDYMDPVGPPLCSAFYSFMSLWDKINGEGSTDSNPWVWVIEFERIDKPNHSVKTETGEEAI